MSFDVDLVTLATMKSTEQQQNVRISRFARYSDFAIREKLPDVDEYKQEVDEVIYAGVPLDNQLFARKLIDVVFSRESNDPLVNVVTDIFAENMYLLENLINNGSDENKKYAYGALIEMFVHKSFPFEPNQAGEKVAELLNMMDIEELSDVPGGWREVNIYLAYKNGCLDFETSEKIRDVNSCGEVVKDFIEGAPEHTEFFVKSWLGALGINEQKQTQFANSWMTIDKDVRWTEKFTYICQRNITRMVELNNIDPNIIQVLHNDFGIVNFGRYPIDVLLDQYDHRNDMDQNFGVWIGAYYDHNTALNNHNSEEEVYALWRQAKESGIGLKIVETDSRHGAIGRLLELAKNNKEIEFLVVSAHGKEDRVMLGIPKRVESWRVDGSSFTTRDFQRKIPDVLKKIFRKNFPVVFLSCLADAAEMTKQFSVQWSDSVVQGAKEKITADGESLNLLDGKGEVLLGIEYVNSKKEIPNVKKGVYLNGQNIGEEYAVKLRDMYIKRAMIKFAQGKFKDSWQNFANARKVSCL